jgi:hypothetical protein
MKKDYRQTLGCFDGHGNFEGGRIVHRTARGEVEGTLFCQSIDDGGHEWFIVLAGRDSVKHRHRCYVLRGANLLIRRSVENIARESMDFYLVEG